MVFDFFLPENEKKLKISLKNLLGFSPRNISLYTQAFRHASVAKEIRNGIKDSNERLEFLGDSVLNLVVTHYLFHKYPYKDEGFLTKMRSKVVSRAHLNQLAVKLGLNKFLSCFSAPALKHSSLHGNAFEALIGAIYLDKGFAFTQKFILNRIFKFHADIEKIIETETDFKSKLIEWSQREKKEICFHIIGEKGSGYQKEFTISVLINGQHFVEATHISKKKAEQFAAEQACIKLGIA